MRERRRRLRQEEVFEDLQGVWSVEESEVPAGQEEEQGRRAEEQTLCSVSCFVETKQLSS